MSDEEAGIESLLIKSEQEFNAFIASYEVDLDKSIEQIAYELFNAGYLAGYLAVFEDDDESFEEAAEGS